MAKRFAGASGTNIWKEIAQDPEIKGVFISLKPAIQFEVAEALLKSGKHIFIEKPPAQNISELNTLAKLSINNNCLVGLQKRYSIINKKLKKAIQLSAKVSYNYQYQTGSYPEGDVLTEVFIHAVDNICYLFGPVAELRVINQSIGNPGSVTLFLQTRHSSGVIGSTELSTAYAWRQLRDKLLINTPTDVWEADYPTSLISWNKPKTSLGLPWEKISHGPILQKIHLQNNYTVPVMENNTLYTQGYFQELETFINLVEGRQNQNSSSPASLLDTYTLLEEIQRKIRK